MSVAHEANYTVALAAKSVIKAGVIAAEIVKLHKSSVELATVATLNIRRELSSGDSSMLNQQELARVGQTVSGRVRIDVVSDDCIRIRYAEGEAVPENKTDMVVGELKPPRTCKIAAIPAPAGAMNMIGNAPGAENLAKKPRQAVRIDTAKAKVIVHLDPYRVEIYDKSGRLVTGVGGPEKNNFAFFDSYNTGVARFGVDNAPLATENFDLAYDECIYGLGEKFVGLNKVGQTIDLNMKDALGVVTQRSYKNVPFYVSNKGYGVFFNHSSLATVWVGSMSAMDIQWGLEDDFLDYYIFLGDIKHVLGRYTDLTGKGALPPAWTFGYWQSKISYQSADEVLDIARNMRENHVPCDVIHLDTFWFEKDWLCDLEFSTTRFPDPAGFLKQLADLGIKVSLWQIPYIPEGSQLFDDLLKVGGFVKDADGQLAKGGFCFTPGFKGRVGVMDYSNPAAVRVQMEYFRRLFRLGVKAIKTDFGEAAPKDGVYADGRPGRQHHNLYPLLYNKALFETTAEETGEGVVWARSAWAGSQRYPLHWGGDNSPNYFNLLPQLAGGLSFGLSGFQFWSQDIGGFCGTTNDQLLIRWMQIGMFISHSRVHGYGNRELYKFAPDTLRICRDYLRLRYALMPYIYAQARACVESSLPMARALVVEYQNDPTVWNMFDEWLFSDDLLVAPIFDESNRRRVYLPEGMWTDFFSGERIEGPCWMTVEADIESLPLYIREGGLVPMCEPMNYVGEKPVKEIELLVSLLTQPGERSLKIPLNNKWVAVKYTFDGKTHTFTLGKTNVNIEVKIFGRRRGEKVVVKK